MGAHYLIGPIDRVDWHLDIDVVRAAVLGRWPDARFETVPTIHCALTWRTDIPALGIICWLNDHCQVLGIDSGVAEIVIPIVLWFRRLVPPEHRLVCFPQNYDWHIEVRPETTAEEIAAVFV